MDSDTFILYYTFVSRSSNLDQSAVVRADDVDLLVLLGQGLVHHVYDVVSVVYTESETHLIRTNHEIMTKMVD